MNIFVLDRTPEVAATYHCDKHVVKMILESAQMICTTAHVMNYDGEIPYKKTHENHPCTRWVRESRDNLAWLFRLFVALHNEWQQRYNHTGLHKSFDKLVTTIDMLTLMDMLPDVGLTPFAQAMPQWYQQEDAVKAYRSYYKNHKSDIATYTKTTTPEWML